jgi:hypothetical protein
MQRPRAALINHTIYLKVPLKAMLSILAGSTNAAVCGILGLGHVGNPLPDALLYGVYPQVLTTCRPEIVLGCRRAEVEDAVPIALVTV